MMKKQKSLTFNEYQKHSRKTAIYPNLGENFEYPTLGLVGEAGEVAEKIKKILRDKSGSIGKKDKQILIEEIGDVLWYLSNLSSELGLKLGDIAEKNIQKLSSRKLRGKLRGGGDKR